MFSVRASPSSPPPALPPGVDPFHPLIMPHRPPVVGGTRVLQVIGGDFSGFDSYRDAVELLLGDQPFH